MLSLLAQINMAAHRYGVPGVCADALEEVVQKRVYAQALREAVERGATEAELKRLTHNTLLFKTTMFSPKLLMDAGASGHRCPRAKHRVVLTGYQHTGRAVILTRTVCGDCLQRMPVRAGRAAAACQHERCNGMGLRLIQ